MNRAGIGLRAPYIESLLEHTPDVGFLEAHSENYFGDSPVRHQLLQLSEQYPISLHGVGLSLGRADGLDEQHLSQLASLVDDVQPILVSEHLSWSGYQHRHLPDLLPIPYTNEALSVFCDHVNQLQDTLKRHILVENPSNYLAFRHIDMDEPEFLNELARRTGCRILLDVNNLYLSSRNVDVDAHDYLNWLKGCHIGQYHLAGHVERERDGDRVWIDSHNQPVSEAVWSLYRDCLRRFGSRPTLIEWDSDFPPLETLEAQAQQATNCMHMERSHEPA